MLMYLYSIYALKIKSFHFISVSYKLKCNVIHDIKNLSQADQNLNYCKEYSHMMKQGW